MSKAILMSINPRWCELIAREEKTIEVRKAFPKDLRTPFKVYIYMTAGDASYPVTILERLTEKIRSAMLWGWTEPSEIAERLIDEGVIAPPCKVENTVWCVLEDKRAEGGWFISEEHATDVSARGIWLSAFALPKDDHGNFIPWEQVGVDTFTTREEAEAALAERRKA